MIDDDRENVLFVEIFNLALVRGSTVKGNNHVRPQLGYSLEKRVPEPIAIEDAVGLDNGAASADRVERPLHNRGRAITIGVIIRDNNDVPSLQHSGVDVKSRRV
jgi:hypothetical protein